ncbi:MAG TPA: DUF1559 domain-containing protein [Gemmataceae bacterium]|jgi:hypothetical protein
MAMQTVIQWRGGTPAALLIGALVLALLTMENSLPADAEGKADALPVDLAKVPSDAMLIVSGRVADLWSSEYFKPAREKYKKEIDEGPSKEFQERFGLPLEQVERMTLCMLSPPPGREEVVWFVHTARPYDLAKIIAKIRAINVKKYKEETLYVGEKDETIFPLDDRSLAYGQLRDIHSLIDHPQPKTEGNLASAVRLAAGKHSVVVGLNVKLFTDSVGNRLAGEAQLEPFLPLFQALSATLNLDVAADSRAAAVLTFASEKDAKDAVKPAETGLVLLRAGLDFLSMQVSKDKEAKDLLRGLKQLQDPLKELRIEQKDASLRAALDIKIDTAMAGLTLVEAVQKLRESAARVQGQNNLKQLGLAMHNYAASMGGRLPANATYSKDGKPLLSWRVLILPYIEQQQLYQEFHLNEPWDSEHNKTLLAKMPKIYASPENEKTVQEHVTHYQAFLGKGAFFEGKQGLRFPAEFVDGTSNTIMFVESANAVPWTKPEDISYDPAKPLPKLGLPHSRGFQAAMCDGSVRMISHNITQQTLRAAITRNGGEILGPDF